MLPIVFEPLLTISESYCNKRTHCYLPYIHIKKMQLFDKENLIKW